MEKKNTFFSPAFKTIVKTVKTASYTRSLLNRRESFILKYQLVFRPSNSFVSMTSSNVKSICYCFTDLLIRIVIFFHTSSQLPTKATEQQNTSIRKRGKRIRKASTTFWGPVSGVKPLDVTEYETMRFFHDIAEEAIVARARLGYCGYHSLKRGRIQWSSWRRTRGWTRQIC